MSTVATERPSPTRGDLAYAMARVQSETHGRLIRAVRASGLTVAELAVRARLDEAVVAHALSRPRNLDLNIVGRILCASDA